MFNFTFKIILNLFFTVLCIFFYCLGLISKLVYGLSILIHLNKVYYK